jgi:Neocarzinostatin family
MTFDPRPPSALDQHLERASRSVEDHVGDYVAPTFDPGARPPRRSSAAAATAVAAVLLLVIAIVAASGGEPEDEVASDVDSPEESFEEVGEAIGGPRDGLDSLRLPVQVSPADGLADGQTVTVTGSQFPPNTQLGVVMCAQFPDRAPAGSGNCQLAPYTSVTTNAEGSFEVQHPVDRVFITSNGEEIDCATAAAPCLVAVGAINDYDQSGVAEVRFDAGIPPLPDPLARVEPEGPYTDGQVITLVLEDLAPGAEVFVDLCADTSKGGSCQPGTAGPTLADGAGRVEVALIASRTIDVGLGPVDCSGTNGWCSISVSVPSLSRSWSFDATVIAATTTDGQSTTTTVPGTAPTIPAVPMQQNPTTTVPAPATTVPPATTTTAPSSTTG